MIIKKVLKSFLDPFTLPHKINFHSRKLFHKIYYQSRYDFNKFHNYQIDSFDKYGINHEKALEKLYLIIKYIRKVDRDLKLYHDVFGQQSFRSERFSYDNNNDIEGKYRQKGRSNKRATAWSSWCKDAIMIIKSKNTSQLPKVDISDKDTRTHRADFQSHTKSLEEFKLDFRTTREREVKRKTAEVEEAYDISGFSTSLETNKQNVLSFINQITDRNEY